MDTYRVAAINPEFFSSLFQMTQHSWKSSELIEVITNSYTYKSRIILFLKTAVSINDSLDPGPQAIAGLRHGDPVEGPQHLLHLLDKILSFVARLCNDHTSDSPHTKKWKELQSGELGGHTSSSYNSTTPSGLHEPDLRPLAFVGKGAIQIKDLMVISSYLSASYDTMFS
jgi:hypothetical protein